MPGRDSTTIDSDAHDDEVDRIIAAYLQQVDAGEKPDRQALLKEHPQFDAELREFLDDLERFTALPNAAPPVSTDKPATASDSRLPKLRYFGEYELIREIARGGMGVVYEARQKSLKRTVAVKMILGGVLASDEDVQRFRTEAQAAAGLQHPNIVSIHEVGVCQNQHYFSMDLVTGSNLAELVKDGALHHNEAVLCVQKLAEAVDYAHSHGILHRDLKPSNILVDELGIPHITDFGLAKLLHDDSGLTATSARLYTQATCRLKRRPAKVTPSVRPAGNIYSLGCILYELLTERPAFRGSSVTQTSKLGVNPEPVSPRDCDLLPFSEPSLARKSRVVISPELPGGTERILGEPGCPPSGQRGELCGR